MAVYSQFITIIQRSNKSTEAMVFYDKLPLLKGEWCAYFQFHTHIRTHVRTQINDAKMSSLSRTKLCALSKPLRLAIKQEHLACEDLCVKQHISAANRLLRWSTILTCRSMLTKRGASLVCVKKFPVKLKRFMLSVKYFINQKDICLHKMEHTYLL